MLKIQSSETGATGELFPDGTQESLRKLLGVCASQPTFVLGQSALGKAVEDLINVLQSK